jgi:hypothetical protein
MTYTVGGLIQAADYNGFANDSGGQQHQCYLVNRQHRQRLGSDCISTCISGWHSHSHTMGYLGQQSGHSLAAIKAPPLTSRTQPVAGNTSVSWPMWPQTSTPLTTIEAMPQHQAQNTAHFLEPHQRPQPQDRDRQPGPSHLPIPSHSQISQCCRYFFNAGGLVKIMYGKSSTGTDHDRRLEHLGRSVRQHLFAGRVKVIQHNHCRSAYTGTTRLGGSGGTQTTLATPQVGTI